jgi:hypothetical protein
MKTEHKITATEVAIYHISVVLDEIARGQHLYDIDEVHRLRVELFELLLARDAEQ